MVGIALDVHYLRRYILRFVSDGVDDRATSNRTIWAERTRLASSRDFQHAKLCVGGLKVESKNRSCRPAYGGEFKEVSSGSLHDTPWNDYERTSQAPIS